MVQKYKTHVQQQISHFWYVLLSLTNAYSSSGESNEEIRELTGDHEIHLPIAKADASTEVIILNDRTQVYRKTTVQYYFYYSATSLSV